MKKAPATNIVITRRARSLYQDRRGQTTVLFALTIMIFICFLAFMVNVAQLVHGRILTQAVADMVALSAANVQAAGMNEIAELNREHRSMQRELRAWMNGTLYFSGRGEVDRLFDYFKDLMGIVIGYKQNVNKHFPEYASKAAEKTLDRLNGEYGGGFAIEELKLSDNIGSLVDLTGTAFETLRGRYVDRCNNCPPLPTYRVTKNRNSPVRWARMKEGMTDFHYRFLDTPYEEKIESTRIYTIAHVTREEMGSLVNLPSLGFDVKIPPMEAVSAAMPTGGNIEEGKATYFARFVPLEAFVSGRYYH